MNRITEQDEFLLSQLLDGDLPDDQAEMLKARIAREPGLRAAFESLQRVHGLLLARQQLQPEVDYTELRSHIMDAVHAARRPIVIRFPLWTRAAGAVAAAAAIALVVWVYGPAGSIDQPKPTPTFVERPLAPAVGPDEPNEPSRSQPGTMLVQFNRPRIESKQGANLKVSYVRSNDLAKAMTARDKERRSRPTWHMYVAQRARTPAGTASPFDVPL